MSFRISRFLPRFLRGEKERTKSFIHKDSEPILGDKKEQLCRIYLLDETEFTARIKITSKGQCLLDKVYDHLNLIETSYFGLRYIDQTNQTHWLDVHKSISSQIKNNSDYQFYFGVKFYVADPCKLQEEITRYVFFLQVKQDIIQGRLPITFEESAELAAYALQSELGDYDNRYHTIGYVSEFRLVPNQNEELEEIIERKHRKLKGVVPSTAEYRFLEKVKWLEMYGVDLHSVLGDGRMELLIGLTPTGVIVLKNKSKVGNYFWPRILKINFSNKLFQLKVRDRNNDEHTYQFETTTKAACKHLWKCCAEHHAFFRLNQLVEPLKIRRPFSRFVTKRNSTRMAQMTAPQSVSRQQPQVMRAPSRRHARRSSSDSKLDAMSSTEGLYEPHDRPVSLMIVPEPMNGGLGRHASSFGPNDSPRSTRSAPWEMHADTGLYTCSGRDSPGSVRSDKLKWPGYRRGGSTSDTEAVQRKKYFSSGRMSSDNESEISVPRRRRRYEESGSESEAAPRRALRQRHARSAGDRSAGEDSDIEWRNNRRNMATGKENIPNGSIPSLASKGEERRRRRRASKSPNRRPPDELKQHFEYGLIETDGMSDSQLQEIQFVNIETKAEPFKVKYNNINLGKQPRHRRPRSYGDLNKENHHPIIEEPVAMIADDAPPPYSSPGKSLPSQNVPMSNSQIYHDSNSRLSAPPNQSYTTEPSHSHNNHNTNNKLSTSFNPAPRIPPITANYISRYLNTTAPSRTAYSTSPSKPSDPDQNKPAERGRQYRAGPRQLDRCYKPPYQNNNTSLNNSNHSTVNHSTANHSTVNHSTTNRRSNPQVSDKVAPQSSSVYRPVYSWSHFQPVRQSPTPAADTGLNSSQHTDITRHVITASGRHERWTEL